MSEQRMIKVMLGILFFILSVAAGYSLLSLCVPQWSIAPRLAGGAIAGITLTAGLSFLLSLTLGFVGGLLLTALLCAFLIFRTRSHWKVEVRRAGVWSWFAALAIGLPAVYLYSTHSLYVGAGGLYVPGYAWGDLAFHMGIISSVAYQPHVPLYFPVFYQNALSYPFLIDFYSGVLLRLGGGWQAALFLPSASLFISACFLSFSAVRSFISAKAAYLHIVLFMLAGSAAGILYFYHQLFISGFTQAYTLFDYTKMDDKGLYFANPVTSHFLPQRSFLLGFSIAMLIICLLLEYMRKQEVGAKLLWLVAVLTGVLPFAHIHTFFVIFALLVLLSGIMLFRNKPIPREWWQAILLSLVLVLPQIWWQFHTTYHDSFGRWYVGWMRAPDENIITFWWRNVGFFLPLLLVTPFVIKKLKNDFLIALYIVGVGIAIATNIRIFQPNDWDNLKFILYAYWILLIPIVWMVRWLWRQSRYWVILMVPVIITMTLPGLLAITRETSSELNFRLFITSDLQVASDFRTLLPADAKVLTFSEHNNIVPTLTGRKILIGYIGWLWTYGINYDAEQTAQFNIMTDAPDAPQQIEKYGLTHLVMNDTDILQNNIPLTVLQQEYPELYNRNGWHVFLLTCSYRTSTCLAAKSTL